MTEIINNVILSATDERRKWKPIEVGETFAIAGECNSQSIRINDAKAVTQDAVTSNGKIYLLGDLQEDYKSFIQAISANIPIIEYWNIKGNQRDGYVISGFTGSTPIKQRIVRKDDNIVTLEDGKRYFVQWRNYSPEFNFRMFTVAIAADDIKFPEAFDWYGDCRCKPHIIVR